MTIAPPLDAGRRAQPGPDSRLHGRRRGRKLRDAQQELLDLELPRCRLTPDEISARGPERLFATPRPLWLEIGFGGGEHAAWQAAQHPDIGVIGCEVFEGGIVSLLAHRRRLGLENLRIVVDDARLVLAALPEASVARAFILFPDPWPKTRHHKRRLISPETMRELARVLTDGAELRLATDDPAYLRVMLAVACGDAAFEWLARVPDDWRTRPADWPQTRYEAKAMAAGRRPGFLRLRRRQRT